jgi:hypothetical protein
MNRLKYVAVICFAAAVMTGISAAHNLANNDTQKAANDGIATSLTAGMGALMLAGRKRSPS